MNVFGIFENAKLMSGKNSISFGTKIAETTNPIIEGFYLNVDGTKYEIDNSMILKVDKSPVFLFDQ